MGKRRWFRGRRPVGSGSHVERSGRWRRLARRAAVSLAVVVALALAAVWGLAHSLDRPWVKTRLQQLVRRKAGVDVDYVTADVALFSGAHIEGLVVRSPVELRPLAAELIRVGRLDVRWAPMGLLRGRAPSVELVAASAVTLAVVVDEHGRSSFDAIPTSAEPAPSPPVPLSQQASKLLAQPLPVGRIDAQEVTIALIRSQGTRETGRLTLRGAAFQTTAGSAEPAEHGQHLDLTLGTPASPLAVSIARVGDEPASARARLWGSIDATSSRARCVVDLHMIGQDFSGKVSPGHWLHAEASAQFDTKTGVTRVRIERAKAGDGAATVDAQLEFPDVGPPIVRSAQADIDGARLLRWLPQELVPFTAERARVRAQIDALSLGGAIHLAEAGSAVVDVDVAGAAAHTASTTVTLDTASFSLRAVPAKTGGLAGKGVLKLARARVNDANVRLDADDLTIDVDAERGEGGEISGTVGARFGRVSLVGRSAVDAKDGRASLRVRGAKVAETALATQGDFALSLDLGSVDAKGSGARAMAHGLSARAHASLDGRAPYAAELEARLGRLRLHGRDGSVAADAPAQIAVRVREFRPDSEHPARSRGVLAAVLGLADVEAKFDATKGTDAVDYALVASAGRLSTVRRFLPPELAGALSLERVALGVRSRGHVEHLGGATMELRHTTDVDLAHPSYAGVRADAVAVTVSSRGTSRRHEGTLELRARGLVVNGTSPRDEHVALEASIDRDHLSGRMRLASEGLAAATLSGTLAFDPVRRAVPYALEGRFAELGPLIPLAAKVRALDGVDLSHLEVDLAARGELEGVVAAVTADGAVTLEPSPMRTAAGPGKADLRLAHVHWTKGNAGFEAPELRFHAELRAAGDRRELDGLLTLGSLHLDLGADEVDLNGVSSRSTLIAVGDLSNPKLSVEERLSVRAVNQVIAPTYSVGDVTLSLSADRSVDGVVHVADLRLANGAAGTMLAARGNLDLGEGRRTVALASSLTQSLARLSTIPGRFAGKGDVSVEANVTSTDLVRYLVGATLKAENVDVTMRRAGFEVQGASGEVPITVALELGPGGVALQKKETRSPYSMLRFSDQHPLLNSSGFVSIARLVTPFVSIAPIVGNFEMNQNVLSLRQFEMGLRGGRVTGQCSVEWAGRKSVAEVHVRANGVQSSHGEPFDGNVAVVLDASDRTVVGRAEILRIGARHLLDLLDMQDPLHVDPAFNRIRSALQFGYPDTLRVVFDHGFASAKLELGGLARFISIGELRGIPTGPLVDALLGPLLDGPSAGVTP